MKDAYTEVMLSNLKNGKDAEAALNDLKRLLEKRGHQRLYQTILKNLLRYLAAEGTKKTTLTVTSEEKVQQLKESIDSAIKSHSFDQSYQIVEDNSIIGGFTLRSTSKLLDNSYKRKLVDLYRSFS